MRAAYYTSVWEAYPPVWLPDPLRVSSAEVCLAETPWVLMNRIRGGLQRAMARRLWHRDHFTWSWLLPHMINIAEVIVVETHCVYPQRSCCTHGNASTSAR